MKSTPWQPHPAPRPARVHLTRDQIVRAALRIVQAEGIEAVSMRRVAAEFGTGQSSLYAHVANKDELLRLMLDEVYGDIELPEPDPARWREQVKEIALNSYAILISHNDLARAALATVPTGPNALRISDAMFGLMLAGGVTPQKAAWALDRIFLYLVADAYEGSLWRSGAPEGAQLDDEALIEHFTGGLRTFFRELPADTFPHLREHATAMTSGGPGDRFRFGLDLLVDGLDRYSG